MICPNDRKQMVNYTAEKELRGNGLTGDVFYPLPSGGIATDDVYETWYVYECPECGRRVKEAYRCEVIQEKE